MKSARSKPIGGFSMSAKVVAITGGAQGIGRAIGYAFAKAGYAVSIADPVADAGEEAAAHIRELGVLCLYERADTSREEDVTRWIARTTKDLGCPHVLVNNAGIMVNKPFLELPIADFDRVQAVNVRGTVMCSQAVAREMVKHKIGGAIINISSTRAFMSEANTESYTASKGAISALTHGMAISLGSYGIRVNSVSPGWIETSDCSSQVGRRRRIIRRPTTNNTPLAGSACQTTSLRPVCFSPRAQTS